MEKGGGTGVGGEGGRGAGVMRREGALALVKKKCSLFIILTFEIYSLYIVI